MSKLKECRILAGFTQEQVGKILGISQEVISQYENGGRKLTLELAGKFAKLYGVSVDTFLP